VTTADINIDQSAVNRVEQKQILLGGTLFGEGCHGCLSIEIL
jgi:hypothetical protein